MAWLLVAFMVTVSPLIAAAVVVQLRRGPEQFSPPIQAYGPVTRQLFKVNQVCFHTNQALHARIQEMSVELAELKTSIRIRKAEREQVVLIGTRSKPANSCQEILNNRGNAPSGVYFVRSGGEVEQVYCHMNTLGSCGGGGWTTLMKVDGRKDTFCYNSEHWTSSTTYHIGGGRSGFDSEEAKLNTFNSMPFKELCVVFKHPSSGEIGHVLILKEARSLLAIIKTDNFSAVSFPGRSTWLNSIPGASLQRNCNRVGFNVLSDRHDAARSRIGIIANNEHDCITSDSVVGIGLGAESNFCSCPSCRNVHAGTFNGCKGNYVVPTYAYILAQ